MKKVKKDPDALKIRPSRDAIDWGTLGDKKFELWNKLREGKTVSLPEAVVSQLSGVIEVGGVEGPTETPDVKNVPPGN